MKITRWFCVGLICSLVACASTPPPIPTVESDIGRISFAGSSDAQPLIEVLAEGFRQHQPSIVLDTVGGGSALGINAVGEGIVDIGISSRNLSSAERQSGIEAFPIALDGIAVIVHPENPLAELSLAQLQAIFRGEILNWQEFGGLDRPIVVVARATGAGTRTIFDNVVLERAPLSRGAITLATAGEVAATVAGNPYAIGYVSLGYLNSELRALAIDGFSPTPEALRDGLYPLRSPIILLIGTLSRPLARSFVTFAQSDAGRQIIADQGLIPIQ